MARSSFLSYYFAMICFSTQNSLMRFQFGADGVNRDFPGGSDSKDSACSAGDPDSIPGLGRFPGEGNGHPLRYSYLENSMDRGFWQVTYSPRGLSPVSSAEYNYQSWIKCMDYIFKDSEKWRVTHELKKKKQKWKYCRVSSEFPVFFLWGNTQFWPGETDKWNNQHEQKAPGVAESKNCYLM